ncbi:MAG: PASTA domain-containing protein [Marinilabiliales bacterium]|nr:MAG: PASTA domain-containing protein [Marinilabiliales bacterium]
MNNFVRFLISRMFWKHLAIIAGITTFVILTIFVGLKIYTRHGRAYAVPDLRGLTVTEAEMVTGARRLRYQVADSVFISHEARGTVIDQNPPPNFRVKENRTIFLTINAMNPERVAMPDVTGVSLRQARAIIETQGLEVGRLIYVPDIAMNNVLRQQYEGNDIEPGELIVRGEAIDLVLGEGLSTRTTYVPDVLYLDKEEARNRILAASLNLGAALYDTTVKNEEDSINAFVWRQRPEYSEGLQIRLGSIIDLWMSVDSTLLPVPDTLEILMDDLPYDEDSIIW